MANIIAREQDFSEHIEYISDLHIDHVKDNNNSELINKKETNLINYLSANSSKSFIFAGDLYDDYSRTLAFIMKLEELGINSYFVLGNHDYWSTSVPLTYRKVIDYVDNQTALNKYAHFLHTGKSYTLGNLTIIGDSGFTNFGYNYERIIEVTNGFSWYCKPLSFATTNDFIDKLPEIADNLMQDWNTEAISQMHKEWLSFAEGILLDNRPVIMVTHWPMKVTRDFAETPLDSWWNVEVDRRILKGDFWQIFGHTHKDAKYLSENNVARQVGYKEDSDFSEISSDWFGKLNKYYLTTELQVSPQRRVKELISLTPVPESARDAIKRRGYARAGNSINKTVLAKYLSDREDFIRDVRSKLHPSSVYAGYINPDSITINENLDLAAAAVQILETGYVNNPFEFVTALIVSGYVYSGMMYQLEEMRKVDIYDIARYTFILQTLMSYKNEIDISNSVTIKKSIRKNSYFTIAGVKIMIPNINGKELSPNELQTVADKLKLVYSLGKKYVIENEN